jgi:hypothetical protein
VPGKGRSTMVAKAMAVGLARLGETAQVFDAARQRGVIAEVAVFYGFDPDLRALYAAYLAAGCKVVTVDLGYWARKQGGARAGYHKVSVNARHPTAYFQRRAHDAGRFAALGVPIAPWRNGSPLAGHVIVAGMSAKSAGVEGFRPEQWERATVARLAELTDRPIVYRPKPSWKEARPIPGTTFRPGLDDLPALLADCHAVVTHHSNVGVDALLAGVPVHAAEGVATRLGLPALTDIEDARRFAGDRHRFAADLAWCQWTPEEMAAGDCWRHLKDEGLV